MRRAPPMLLFSFVLLLASLVGGDSVSAVALGQPALGPTPGVLPLVSHIVAAFIPGASAISTVGTFLNGGPIRDNPAFAAFAASGRVLDPTRLLVGSTSNFGAPLANPEQLPGSLLSIDSNGDGVVVVPQNFASSDGQASALSGRVQLFSAQSPAFVNRIHNSSAITTSFTGVSNPLGLSINNAFGRLWPANAPYDLSGIGTSTVLDPSGEPLAGAPNKLAGGVFAGSLTPRIPQVVAGGLNSGAVGTALLGRSPDGSRRAVFAVVLADGSIVQVHTAQAVDGLAPPGTVSPLLGRHWTTGDQVDKLSPRLGVLLNYRPTRVLYVSEPFQDDVVAIDLTDDGSVFRSGAMRRIQSDALSQPVDLAPVKIETSDSDWASNTTLDVSADLYVANRGNNTIVRMRQDGTLVARREVRLPDGSSLGAAHLNGIAGSPDGSKIFVTVVLDLHEEGGSRNPAFPRQVMGAVLELPAF